MKIVCPSCGVSGNLPDSQIPSHKININIECPKCRSTFDVAVNSPSVGASGGLTEDSPAPSPGEAPQTGLPDSVANYSPPEDSDDDPFAHRKKGPVISDRAFSDVVEEKPKQLPDYSPPEFNDSIVENFEAESHKKPNEKLSEASILDFSGSSVGAAISKEGSDVAASFGGDGADSGDDYLYENSEKPDDDTKGEGSDVKGYLLRDQNFKFFGLGKELFLISAVNLLLTIITFGVYRFWAKIKVRKYFYSQTEFLREKLEFHGTGLEMLKGFFRFLLIILPLIGLKLLFEYDSGNSFALMLGSAVEFVMFWGLLPIVLVGSLKYRMSRTSWHGIRFSFRGDTMEAIKIYLKAGILLTLTLGFYYIYFRTNWQRYLRSNVYYGNKHGAYFGTGGDLVKPFYKKLIFFYFCLFLIIFLFISIMAVIEPIAGEGGVAVVGGVLALSIVLLAVGFAASLKALFFSYDWDNTVFEDIKFSSTADTSELFKLYVSNFFIFVFTLGLGTPWITVRNYLFRSYHIRLDGSLDVEVIKQEFLDSGASGDIGSDFFEIDAGAF